ncbi:hypothetical protein G419_14324 [Rhodococcus triatomae BKS 15-14]|nr:hypothetical protein G419_14324 [Rhodococcus triatomae BKS 15-14]
MISGCSGQSGSEEIEVSPGKHTVGHSADGGVTVDIPGSSVTSEGALHIDSATTPDGRHGWSIELGGTELTGAATLRFPVGDLEPGEPVPVVTYAANPEAEPTVATDVRYDSGDVVVTTDHFSFWLVDRWNDVRASATSWLRGRFDDIASFGYGAQPTCPGEREVRDAGFDATSDQGKRVYWCLGQDAQSPLLKAVNARGYGVSVEYTPGLEFAGSDRKDWIGHVADLLRPAPINRGNHVELLPSGSEIEFDVIENSTSDGVMIRPEPASYLLTALDFGVGTYAMAIERVGGSGAADKFLTAMEGASCLSSFSKMTSSDLDGAGELTQFFNTALNMALDCAEIALEEADLGPVLATIIAPVIWVVDGVRTAIDGFIGAAESIDRNGYQIIVHRPTADTEVAGSPAADTEIIEVVAVDDAGEPLPDWRARNPRRTTIDCSYPFPSVSSRGTDVVTCGSTADAAHTCWVHTDRQSLTCAIDPWKQEYSQYQLDEPLGPVPAAEKAEPEWIELDDGTHCFRRHGGAWGARADDLAGAYYCEGVDYFVLVDEGPAIDTSTRQWTVRVGEMGAPDEVFPAPTVARVARAYFTTSPD